MKSRSLKYVGYAIYCILLTLGLLWYLFPSEQVRELLEKAAKDVDPRIGLSMERIRPYPALGVRCLDARAFFEESPNFPFFRATSLVVKPRIPSFLAGEPQIAFHCKAYGGDLTGYIDLHDRNGKHPKKSRIEARNIQLSEYEYPRSTSGLSLEGTLFADLEIDDISQHWLDRQGNLRLSVSKGRVLLTQPIFGLDSIDIQDLEISLLLRRGKIDLTHLELKGKDLQVRLLGSIVLEKQIQASRLDLKGEMGLPLKSLTGQSDTDESDPSPFFFAVEGTLAEPKLRIMQDSVSSN